LGAFFAVSPQKTGLSGAPLSLRPRRRGRSAPLLSLARPLGGAIYFFSVKIPLHAACFEENIYREVEKVEEGSQKRDVKVKTFLTANQRFDSTLR
jgi:hypothetical protein